jgi:hypothetical protein
VRKSRSRRFRLSGGKVNPLVELERQVEDLSMLIELALRKPTRSKPPRKS